MGKIKKGVKCVVQGCESSAIRSLSVEKLDVLDIDMTSSKRGYLCQVHYKEYKKKTKKERLIDKWRLNE